MSPSVLHFQMSRELIFGDGCVKELPKMLRKLSSKRPFIVTDPGLVKAGTSSRIAEQLQGAGWKCALYEKVASDPRIEVALDCLEAAKAFECDLCIGLGGGSSLDIAKVVAMLLRNHGDLSDYLGIDRIPQRGVPTLMIPTTAGTGSEVTPIAILSDTRERLKKGIVSDHLYPDVALIDPELTRSVPSNVTAYTGLDALTHAIEAYTNKFSQPFINTFALESIRLIGEYLRVAVEDGNDATARYHMSLASLYGGLCLGTVNTAAVHALAYPLGGMFDVPHGMANALLLPHVMEFNTLRSVEKYANVARALGMEGSDISLTEAARASSAIVRELAEELDVPLQLRNLNIPESAIEEMAKGALKVTRLLNNNPREVSLKDAVMIYTQAY